MVAKQLPQATFRISDNDLWESFKAKTKTNGTNASAVFWQFAKSYVDDNLASVASVASVDINLDEHYKRLVAVVADCNMELNKRIDNNFAGIQDALTQRDREIEALKLELENIKTAIATGKNNNSSEATASPKKSLRQLSQKRVIAA